MLKQCLLSVIEIEEFVSTKLKAEKAKNVKQTTQCLKIFSTGEFLSSLFEQRKLNLITKLFWIEDIVEIMRIEELTNMTRRYVLCDYHFLQYELINNWGFSRSN